MREKLPGQVRTFGAASKRALAAFVFLFGSTGAYALQLAPSYQFFTAKAGATIEGQFTITNNEDEDLYVSPFSKDWFVLPENEKFTAPEWLLVDETEFVLKKGDSKVVPFTIKVPKKAVGELVAMMSFNTLTETRQTVSFMLSSAVYLAIDGKEKVGGRVAALSVQPSTGSVAVGVVVENEGNVHLRPYGMVRIFTDKDKPMANIELKRGKPVYPGKSQGFFGDVADLRLPPGKYKATIELRDLDRDIDILTKEQAFVINKKNVAELR